jgi:malonyl CoA-acyl carrier protein transacylase/acyl carrier protein
MGQELAAVFPVFARVWGQVWAHFGEEVGVHAPEGTGWAQPALFALEVALFRLLESWGVRADVLVGHSVGEVAAAHVAGVLSLADACALVGARARLMQGLPSGGAMLRVAVAEQEVARRGWAAEVAAVNGPASVVLAGPREVLAEVARTAGAASGWVRASHAFHSALVEPMLEEFGAVLGTLAWGRPGIPVVSTLTGRLAEGDDLACPGYWLRQARHAVRFADAVSAAAGLGVTRFAEVGPGSALAVMAGECLEPPAAAVALLRAGLAEPRAVLAGVGELFCRGADADWAAVLREVPDQRVDLPTYAFQRQRYWLRAGRGAGDVSGAGLGVAGHPLLGAAVVLAGGGRVWTGRWSVESLPWLGDHVVAGSVLVAGAVWAELALFAGGQAGGLAVRELVLLEPLVLAGDGGVQVQVWAGEADGSGAAELKIYSRPDGDPDGEWTQHVAGVLAAGDAAGEGLGGVWPPAGAAEVPLEGVYERLAGQGYEYGPVFRGLRRVWRDGGDLLAEVELDEAARQEAGRYGLHPALLDAALQTVLAGGPAGGQGEVMLPFAWQGVSLAAVGAVRLRVRVRPGADGFSVVLADGEGLPVAQVGSLVSRPVAAGQLRPAGFVESLYALEWVPVPVPVLVPVPVPGGGDLVVFEPAVAGSAVREVVAGGLAAVQRHLAGGEGVLLVVASQEEPGGAALWGLVRSAQSEHPGRFVLADCDGDPGSRVLLPHLAGLGEPQLLVRAGAVWARRLARVESGAGEGRVWDRDGTVLVTGGTGGLGALVARHLAACGVRGLVLASRRGPGAAGAAGLAAELAAAGASVSVLACDVTDRQALAGVVEGIGGLRGVVHAAGVLDDGVIESLTPERLGAVLAVKAEAAWSLHELTAGIDLDQFVLFSSAAGVLGGPGQGSYAAANAYLDALAAARRAGGLAGVSLAWGMWEQRSGMTGHLDEADLARMARGGLLPMPTGEALRLLDIAVAGTQSLLVPARIDLRSRPDVPALLRGLVRTPLRHAASAVAGSDTLRQRVTVASADDQEAIVLQALRQEIALVLGYRSPDGVPIEQPFSNMGFDSLTAVELRNRLSAATGLTLSATTIFDYPTPAVLGVHLRERMAGDSSPHSVGVKAVDQLEKVLGAFPADDDRGTQLAQRLRKLLDRWTYSQRRSEDSVDDLESASNEELIQILDKELRK